MTSNDFSDLYIGRNGSLYQREYSGNSKLRQISVNDKPNGEFNNKNSLKKKFKSLFKNSKDSNGTRFSDFQFSKEQSVEFNEYVQPKEESTLNNTNTKMANKFQSHQIIRDLINIVNRENDELAYFNFPIDRSSFTPGIIGIANHGNTCYMNVIIQCLAHLDGVTEYFATQDYLTDIQEIKSKSSLKTAHSTKYLDLTLGFSLLLQSLWNFTYTNSISLKFRELISSFIEKYNLHVQQDAHEYLGNLLTLIKSSLVNTSSKSRSFIDDKLELSIYNQLTCYKCKYTKNLLSNLYNVLDLSIPDNSFVAVKEMVYFILVNNCYQLFEKHAIKIDNLSTVGNVRTMLASRLNCASSDVLLVEVKDTGFGRILLSKENMMDICQQLQSTGNCIYDSRGNGLYAVYIRSLIIDVDSMPVEKSNEQNTQSNGTKKSWTAINNTKETYLDSPFIRLLIVHIKKTEDLQYQCSTDSTTANHRRRYDERGTARPMYQRFSRILTVQASRKTRLDLLRRSLTEQMCKSLNVKHITKLPTPRIVIEDSYVLKESDMYPFADSRINEYLKMNVELCKNDDDDGVSHGSFITVNVVWPSDIMQQLLFNKITALQDISLNGNNRSYTNQFSKTKIVEHESVKLLTRELEQKNEQSDSTSLTDCLNHYFVSDIDSWECDHCKQNNKARSKFFITKAPEVLIISFKRFHGSSKPSPNISTNHRYSNNDNKTVPRYSNPKNLPSNVHGKVKISRTLSHNPPVQFSLSNFDRASSTYRHQHSSPPPYRSNNNGSASKYCIDSFDKLERFVEYPMDDFDLKPYMDSPKDDDEEYKYDLVGVVNHFGTTTNGHYTAFCRNSYDQKWWLFDDEKVTQIQDVDSVINQNAYILFYQKRSTRFMPHAQHSNNQTEQPKNSSSSSSVHWCLRRLKFPIYLHTNLPKLDPTQSHSSSTDTITLSMSLQRPQSLTNHIPSPQVNLSNPFLISTSSSSSALSLTASSPNNNEYDNITPYDSGTVISNDSWPDTITANSSTNQNYQKLPRTNHDASNSIITKVSDECYNSQSTSSPISQTDDDNIKKI